MKKIIILLSVMVLLLVVFGLPGQAEGVWTQSVTHGTQFAFSGEQITINHTTVPDGLDYIEQTFTPAQEVTFEFDAKLGALNNDNFSLVLESDGGNNADGLWLSFKPNFLCDRDNEAVAITMDEWVHYRIVSTRDKLLAYVNGELKYERAGTFRTRSFLRFRDYGRCGGVVTNYLKNVRIYVAGSVSTHGTQFIQENNQLKIIHTTVPNGLDYYRQGFPALQDIVIDFDAKIGSVNNDNFSLLLDSDGEGAPDGLRLAFNQNKLNYYVDNRWREIATVSFDTWSHYRIISTQNRVEIYVNGEAKYARTGTFQPRSYLKFSDYGLCSGPVTNYVANLETRAVTSSDPSIAFDSFDFQTLSGWTIDATHGANGANSAEFTQSGNTIRVVHSTSDYGYDSIRQNFDPLSAAVIEFDAKIGQVNNDNFSLCFESDGGYNGAGGLGFSFKANQVMAYVNNNWQPVFTVDFNKWFHYRIVSTPEWVALYINDDLKYKQNGECQTRSYIKFSDFGLCSGPVTNYLTNVRVRPADANDGFVIYDDFNNSELYGWDQTTSHGTQFSQSDNGIRIIHSAIPNGFDSITQDFQPFAEAVFEFDAKLGSTNNDNFSLLVESDGGYAASDGLGLAFYGNTVMTYANSNWQAIFTVPFDTWQHYKIVSTSTWVAIYINDDLKYKRNGTFRIRNLIKFSDFGLCSGPVTNYLANVQTRAATSADKFIVYDDFNYQPLTGWTTNVTHGTQFSQNSVAPAQGIRIIHATAPGGFDSIQKTFSALPEAVFEFDAKVGALNNDNFSLLFESDGGYAATNGLGLAFKGNSVMTYLNNDWQAIGTVTLDKWFHYRIVSTPGWIAVYINDELKYYRSGTFLDRSFIKFSDFGLCSGMVTNYLANVRTRVAAEDDKFIACNDFNDGTLSGWTVNAPDGTQFIPENDVIKINHKTGTWGNDYIQRTFDPIQNVVLEFDAKIGSANTSHSLNISSDDSGANGFLSFYQNYIYIYNPTGANVATITRDVWNHYRLVFTATKIEVYVNGALKYTGAGTYNPRSYFRFNNAGKVVVTNYIDNVSIWTQVPEAASTNSPDWTSDWTVQNPTGTQFIQTDNLVTINHVTGSAGADYLKRTVNPLQNVAFEFDAKIGSVNNTSYSLLIDSDGGSGNGGLHLAFSQNSLRGYFDNAWTTIQTIEYDTWNHYRIVSTLKKIEVYVNGILKYTYAGTLNPRSYLRFANYGFCAPTNYLKNISIQEVIPDATYNNEPDWARDWTVHNPTGTLFIREDDTIKINHVVGGAYADYIQRTFDPVQNVVLEFDAKISTASTGTYSLIVQSSEPIYYLALAGSKFYAHNGAAWVDLGAIVAGQWNHYRVVCTATKIEFYLNGVLKYTRPGTFSSGSNFRFSNYGAVAVTNYIDNVSIRTQVPAAVNTTAPEWTSDWTVQNPTGTQFIQTDNLVTINHVTGSAGADYLKRTFNPLQNVAFEFDAKIGSVNNTSYSLLVESDGGSGNGGLYLSFYQNRLSGFFDNAWTTIQTIGYDEWNHYRIVSTLKTIEVYVNGILKYTYAGTFNPRSYLRFANYGFCAPTNYIKNFSIQEVIPDATYNNEPDWARDWTVHNPTGTLFIREDDTIKINHVTGTSYVDYIQRTFDPVQNVVLEFDAKIVTSTNSISLVVQSSDPAYYLALSGNILYAYSGAAWVNIGTTGAGQWNHYRVVCTATKIELYMNGSLKYTRPGTFSPRSNFRFSNYGAVAVTNYLDNVCIHTLDSSPTGAYLPGLPWDWTIHNPGGTKFEPENQLIKISHATGSEGNDYIQRTFDPLQDAVFEFGAKIGQANNTNYSLLVESDGGKQSDGIYFGFYQNQFRGYFGSWQNIATINYDQWNYYRIVSTTTQIQVYVNGALSYTKTGSFRARSYLRFSNYGACTPVNYIANIRVTPLATWNPTWYLADPGSGPTGNTPPDAFPPVLLDILPLNNTIQNGASVVISGKVSDSSPVNVKVNGQAANVGFGKFYIQVPVNEGVNNLVIEARDSEGNLTTVTRTVIVDNQPPAEFTPVANVSGWTNNNRPTITFSTTDAASGIDHYEISVAGGAWKTPVTSPYQFTSIIPDGEQTIQVKAVDRAGNYRVGTVQVQIDTTSPAAPEGFEVIPGIDKITVAWTDPQGEITSYRITRTPAFSGGSTVDLTRSDPDAKLDHYYDQDVIPGQEYIYTVKAIDHAGNIGAPAAAALAQLGSVEKALNNKNGGAVKFDNCAVTFDPNVFGQDPAAATYRVEIEEHTGTIPASETATAVSPTYAFSVKDQNGLTLEREFETPVTLTVSYEDSALPEGCTPLDLGIYWYDREGGYWVKLEHVGNDIERKVLTTELVHFSEYQVMASRFTAPSLESYYNMGISPFQAYFQNNLENVSTSSGKPSVEATDVTLPSPNGFDMKIQRSYDLTAAEQNKTMETNDPNSGQPHTLPEVYYDLNGKVTLEPLDASFSYGWSLDIPWIEGSNPAGQYLRLPGGQKVMIRWKNNKFENHEGSHFTLVRHYDEQKILLFWALEISHREITTGFKLTLKDGTVYDFDKYGRPVRQLDPSGQYEIDYGFNNRELGTMANSFGQTINFEYITVGTAPNQKRVIQRIKYSGQSGDRTVVYDYDAEGCLIKVTQPMNRLTSYEYLPLEQKVGVNYPNNPNPPKTFVLHALKKITYPTKGTSEYEYDPKSQEVTIPQNINGAMTNVTYYGQNVLVKKHTVTDNITNLAKVTEYTFNMNDRYGTPSIPSYIPANTYLLSSSVSEGGRVTTETYQQLVKRNSYSLSNGLGGGAPNSIKNYKGDLLVSTVTTNEGAEYETVKYTYLSMGLEQRTPNIDVHLRGGTLAYSTTRSYDLWGNLTSSYDGSRNLTETWTYGFQGQARNKSLVSTYTKLNINPLSGLQKTITTAYQYGPNNTLNIFEKPEQITVTDGITSRITSFTYDIMGNVLKKTDPNGLETE
ncbi:MAG TPA: hypothetical protein VHY08_07070, partial [Bacillota bacterium]|nr:hypothetical protein [Bacillota bacterium]